MPRERELDVVGRPLPKADAAAEGALGAIRVRYEELQPVMSIEEALREPADEPIHDRAYTRRPANIHRQVSYEFGDLDAGFAAADHVREDLFFFQGNTHLPMEQHS